ncbi:hypothetical protein SATMO3_05410 [Sporomusa aerivorans]
MYVMELFIIINKSRGSVIFEKNINSRDVI